uniref:hypothetical protein n=1 Tax=uncultured Allobacillus sp. TaxID=1638025 RepID=UPI002593F32A|nr:hypothetical protein [uncultured Allobacillus sp.]
MNRKLIVLLLTMIIALVACSDNQTSGSDVNAKDNDTEEKQDESSSNESQSDEKDSQGDDDKSDVQPATEVELSEASEPSNLEDYIEMDRVMEEINVDSYTLYLVTDNPGKRVIIYTKDEEQLYKSVYVKRNALLKLIDLQENKPVIVEEIQ